MRFDFKGRKIIAAGGSRGIGQAIAPGFAEEGAEVSIGALGGMDVPVDNASGFGLADDGQLLDA